MNSTRSRLLRFAAAATAAAALALGSGAAGASAAEPQALTPGGLVGVDWKLNASSTDVHHLVFPITPVQGGSGYYWAQQFYFAGGDHVGYTGVQPASGGRFLFSIFGAGPTTGDANCSDGADGGSGVSCAVQLPMTQGRAYDLHVDNTGGNTWAGTVVDTATGASTHIGSWTVPSSWGALKSSGIGFVEYYTSAPSCAEVPLGRAVFGPASSSDRGAGTTYGGYAYGSCDGTTPVSISTPGGGGQDVTTGS